MTRRAAPYRFKMRGIAFNLPAPDSTRSAELNRSAREAVKSVITVSPAPKGRASKPLAERVDGVAHAFQRVVLLGAVVPDHLHKVGVVGQFRRQVRVGEIAVALGHQV